MIKVAPYLVWLPLLAACTTEAPSRPLVAAGVSPALVATASRTVVMSGLDAPRGLAWGPEGALYVAEAGGAAINGPCAAVARGTNCYSGTGAVTRLWRGKQERVAAGLPSAFNPALTDIIGPDHLSFVGRGNLAVTVGWGAAPAARAGLGALGSQFGRATQGDRGGYPRVRPSSGPRAPRGAIASRGRCSRGRSEPRAASSPHLPKRPSARPHVARGRDRSPRRRRMAGSARFAPDVSSRLVAQRQRQPIDAENAEGHDEGAERGARISPPDHQRI